MRKIGIDFETFYDTQYSITKLGNYGYTRHEQFDPYCVSVADGTESWAGHPRDFNWDALKGEHLFSHNRSFDRSVLEAMQEKGLAPQVDYHAWHCTADLSVYLSNRRSLADAVEFFYGEHMSKQVRADMKGKRVDDLSPEEREALYKYADDDAIWCQRIATDHFDSWPEQERRLSCLTGDQGDYGVRVDTEALQAAITKIEFALLENEDALPWIKQGKKPTSPIAIAEECRKVGIPPPPVKSHDEDAYHEWHAKYSPLYPWVEAVGARRSINKFLSSLYTIRDRLRPDGTFPFGVKYFGGHTGRWSGDGGFNMQNMMRVPFHGVDMRSLFIPRPGKKFIIGDLAQIEARVVQWLAGNEELMRNVAAGFSIYEAYARATGRWSGDKVLKETDPDLYNRIKASVLSLGFGAGAEKYVSMARIYGVNLTLEESEREVQDFRNRNPLVTALWRQLDNGLRASVGSDYEVELPSGRMMRYRDVRYESRPYRQRDGSVRRRTICTADIGRRQGVYGGLLAENITQATARDIFAEAMLRVEDAGIRVLWSVHDEVICEVDPDVSAKEIEQLMSGTPEWAPGLPVAAEAHDAMCYGK